MVYTGHCDIAFVVLYIFDAYLKISSKHNIVVNYISVIKSKANNITFTLLYIMLAELCYVTLVEFHCIGRVTLPL